MWTHTRHWSRSCSVWDAEVKLQPRKSHKKQQEEQNEWINGWMNELTNNEMLCYTSETQSNAYAVHLQCVIFSVHNFFVANTFIHPFIHFFCSSRCVFCDTSLALVWPLYLTAALPLCLLSALPDINYHQQSLHLDTLNHKAWTKKTSEHIDSAQWHNNFSN